MNVKQTSAQTNIIHAGRIFDYLYVW